MAAPPSALAHALLKNILVVCGVFGGGVLVTSQVITIANRREMRVKGSGEKKVYNLIHHPEQERLDTILDRTKIMQNFKEKKPWNMTFAEKEAAKRTSS